MRASSLTPGAPARLFNWVLVIAVVLAAFTATSLEPAARQPVVSPVAAPCSADRSMEPCIALLGGRIHRRFGKRESSR